jgi:3-deoxy-D-manno-octulosonic-acid transferase
MNGVPGRFRLCRLLLAGFQLLATLRMLVSDRQPLHSWLDHLLPRLGFFPERAAQTIWIHGEGMGEFNAVSALITALREELPDVRFLFTASRSVTLEWLRDKYPEDLHVPHPWDLAAGVSRFVRRLNPCLIVLLEFHDAFCPGALLWAREAGVPCVVVNARSLHANRPWRFRIAAGLGLVGASAHLIDHFLAQDDDSAAELLRLSGRVNTVGNLKYDFTPPVVAGLRPQWRLPPYAPVLIAACIHPDEEALITAMIAQLRGRYPKLRFVVAPYSATQLDSLEARLHNAGLTSRRTSELCDESDTSVLVLDTFGILASAYSVAQLVVLGGSFTHANAGHSLVEAAAHGKAIVFGPHTTSQTAMVRTFLAANAAIEVPAAELVPALDRLLKAPTLAIEMGERARAVVAQNAGATARTLTALTPLLPGARAIRPAAPEQADESCGNVTLPRFAFATPGIMVKSALKRLALTPPGQFLLATRSQRLHTLDALREQLGHPDTILCLGNGPSSEAPCLGRIAYDALFRVNWRWVGRGRFTRPDVVFTGDRDSLRRCPPPRPGRLFHGGALAAVGESIVAGPADERRGDGRRGRRAAAALPGDCGHRSFPASRRPLSGSAARQRLCRDAQPRRRACHPARGARSLLWRGPHCQSCPARGAGASRAALRHAASSMRSDNVTSP